MMPFLRAVRRQLHVHNVSHQRGAARICLNTAQVAASDIHAVVRSGYRDLVGADLRLPYEAYRAPTL
jgi:hypothetical protein